MWSAKRWFRSSGSRGAVTVLATLSVVAGLTTAAPPPARAADPGVSDLVAAVGQVAQWTSGLATVGKLGEQLPFVSASPGGLLGYSDLVQEAVADEIAGATEYGQLAVDKPIDLGAGRTGQLTTTVADEGAGKKLTVTVDVNRTATGQNMHLAGGDVDLTISKGIDVGLKSRFKLSLVWTGSDDNKVYVVSGTDGPRLDLDATATIDPAKAEAAFGILGVTLGSSSLTLKAHFAGKVNDPNNDGKLFFTENAANDGELAQNGSLEGLFDIGFDPRAHSL